MKKVGGGASKPTKNRRRRDRLLLHFKSEVDQVRNTQVKPRSKTFKDFIGE